MFAYALVFNNEGIKLMGDIKKSKFNSLTPELLEENEPIYTEALDYAFNNSEIKNIAITGIYGAGKSTVWNTYKKYKLNQVNEGSKENTLKNTITVSLGKFFDESAQELDKDNISLKDLDNRVERQLINQILSQIKSSDVLFSKYRFKTNLDQKDLFFSCYGDNIICCFYLVIGYKRCVCTIWYKQLFIFVLHHYVFCAVNFLSLAFL